LNGFIDGLVEHETRLTAAETGSTALLMNVTGLRTAIDEAASSTAVPEPTYNSIVPLYAYPAFVDWGYVVNATPVNRRVLVANPASGPGVSVDSTYTTALTNARAAGWRVLAYVNTDLAFASPRTEAAIKADLDTWLSLYPGLVDGVFFDWWGTGVYGSGHNTIQSNVADYARARVGDLIVGNMGTFPENSANGQAAMATANITCIFEGSHTAWQGAWSPPAFVTNNYTASQLYMLVYGDTVTATTTASRSGTVTSLAVAALPQPVTSGQPVWISSGANSQQFIASANAAAGATSIAVTSQTANATYASGSTVTYDDWLTTAETATIIATAKARGIGWMFVTPAGLGYNSMPWGTYASQAWIEAQWAAIDAA
jgi:hypothetical protein